MRCHLATAATVQTPAAVNPIDAVVRFVTRPLADGLMLTDHLIAGAAASAGAVAAMHPLDTLKTLIQKTVSAATAAAPATVGSSASVPPSSSAFGMLMTTFREKGIGAFYKGLTPNLVSQVPSGAIKFAAYESLTQLTAKFFPDLRGTAVNDYLCAALAFVVCSVTLVPGELVKQRLQAGVYPNMVSAFTDIFRAGPRAMYTGYAATLIRDVPYTMLEFGLYAQFKRASRLLKRKENLTPGEEIALGGLAGGCTGFLTTPLDLAKTRLMTQASGSARQYSGVFDVLTKVARNEGLPALFKGSVPRVVWLIPFTALYFGIHEATKRALVSRRASLQSNISFEKRSAFKLSSVTNKTD